MNTTAAVKTFVTFQSDLFNNTEQHDYFVNPDCFGDDVCKFMISKLKDRGVQCSDPCGQDWGWMFRLQFDGREFDFGTNYHMDGFWLGFVNPWSGFFGNLFGRANKAVPVELTRILHQILTTAAGIRDVQWHEEQEFNKGKYEAGTDIPS